MMPNLPDLPVREAQPALLDVLEVEKKAVLVAPPGAGKTTLVPLALLDRQTPGRGTILLLEPRRLAARAAARRMAALIGEEPGRTVGYAMRMERKVSEKTRMLVVTEGVLSRMILDDPELSGISTVIFDEFHERSLDGDFGLALALDAQGALRPDLNLLVMSATLDGARISSLLGNASVIESKGRSFPVEIRHRERSPDQSVEEAVATAVRDMLASEQGSILAFLPGQREIDRTGELLEGRVPVDTEVMKLHGGLDGRAQDAAIRPAEAGRRKVVLATAIAETSVTIDGVTIVVDCGLSRLPKYEPATGLTRLETVRVSRASADQRAGRAGRTAPGIAVRLWRAEQTAALPAFTPPEILEADLSGLLLDCAAFGVTDPRRLAFLDPPPDPALEEARKLLLDLDAIDLDGRLTETGTAMRRLALPVRLAHMVTEGAKRGDAGTAAELAVLLTERGLGGNSVDLDRRLMNFRRDRAARAVGARQLAERLARMAASAVEGKSATARSEAGRLLIHAYPDRVAKARGEYGRFVLANGRGGVIDAADPLAKETYLVVADLQGRAQNARIASAASIGEEDIAAALANRIQSKRETSFDPERGSIRVRETHRLGAIVLGEASLPPPKGAEADQAVIDAIRRHGLGILPWDWETQGLRRRLAWLHDTIGSPWPDMSDDALLDSLKDWLLPFLTGSPNIAGMDPQPIRNGLMSLVPHDRQRAVERLAPTHFDAPSGSRVPIRYEAEGPVLAIRVQEVFGLRQHPTIGENTPLKLELLSPAQRPIQTTLDLPGFWRGSWADVRAAMRGRYPKHVWPEDPATATATNRAKPRGK